MKLNDRQSNRSDDKPLTRLTSTGGVRSMIAELGKDKALEVYTSHPEAWPAEVKDVPLGLTDCPSGSSTNASWLEWKERLLSRSVSGGEEARKHGDERRF